MAQEAGTEAGREMSGGEKAWEEAKWLKMQEKEDRSRTVDMLAKAHNLDLLAYDFLSIQFRWWWTVLKALSMSLLRRPEGQEEEASRTQLMRSKGACCLEA